MTGSTKILTVSYGTFSCTLEGFDDPFATMRGIAEYFRDLAADDRYFGAEPPTPDVEMLQRIAEKEVQRRVEARLGESGVALTQVTDETARPSGPKAADEIEDVEDAGDADVVRRVARAVSQPSPAAEVAENRFDHGPLAPDEDYLLSDEPEDVLAVDPDARPPSEGPAETVAEKLRRIRAVVSRNIEQKAAEDDRSFRDGQARDAEDLDAEGLDAEPKRERAMTETIRQISADLADDEEPADEDINIVSDDVVSLDADEIPENGFSDAYEADEDDEPTSAIAAPDDAPDDDLYEDELEDEDAGSEPEAHRGWAAADTEETRDDTVEMLGDTSVEDTVSQLLASERGHAAAEAAESDVLKLDEDSTVDGAEEQGDRKRPQSLKPILDSDGDVGRILAETDSKLNDDEGIRRRRVISQMRAAVAATKADRLVSRRVTTREAEDAAEQEPYRDALSEVVRQVSRPMSAEAPVRRAGTAPLVLVSSQRVDEPEPSPSRGDIEGFAGFARSMGAKELTELLEAAAAYSAFVEGQPSFSRPEIMKRVARVDPALKLSREDGLRSFGQLLRQGKFQKLERGQFTITKNSRFNPQQRAAGE